MDLLKILLNCWIWFVMEGVYSLEVSPEDHDGYDWLPDEREGYMATRRYASRRPYNYFTPESYHGPMEEDLTVPGNLLFADDHTTTSQAAETIPSGETLPPLASTTEPTTIRPEYLKIFPTYGPIAGKTLITISSNYHLDNETTSITFNHSRIDFNYSVTDSGSSLKFLTPPTQEENVSVALTVDYLDSRSGVNESTAIDFTYKPNPVLENIQPRVTIKSGGTKITVIGQFFDSVAEPLMFFYWRSSDGNETFATLNSSCDVFNSTLLTSITPAIAALEYESQSNLRRKRQIDETDNRNYKPRWEYTIGVLFDGVNEYKDLANHPNISYRRLSTVSVYLDPEIETFQKGSKSEVMIYDPNEEDSIIRVHGKYLQYGGPMSDYQVTIGDSGVCKMQYLAGNLLTCEPPNEKPKDTSNTLPFRGTKAPHIEVKVGRVKENVGYVYYKNNYWLDNDWPRVTVYTVCGIILLVVVAVVVLVRYRRNQRRNRRISKIDQGEANIEQVTGPFLNRKLDPELQQKLDRYRISPERLKIGANIGNGHFGSVHEGQLVSKSGNLMTVAIKTLKKDKDMSFEDLEAFLMEAVIMLDFRHENVLSLVGIILEKGDRPLVVLPYMEHGDLRKLISDSDQEILLGDLVHFGYQIANGMAYLSNERFVHRDLAARNCMVSSLYVIKIADFGMSRDVYDTDYYQMENTTGKHLPAKWMAIESLQEGRYTTKSDVWSFGVTMWELLTRGSCPYPGIDNYCIKGYICNGGKPDKPEFCPQVLYEVLEKCWDRSPDDRPTFPELRQFLEQLLENNQAPSSERFMTEDYDYARCATREISGDHLYAEVNEFEDYLTPIFQEPAYCDVNTIPRYSKALIL